MLKELVLEGENESYDQQPVGKSVTSEEIENLCDRIYEFTAGTLDKKERAALRRPTVNQLDKKYYFWALYLPNWESDDYAKRLEKFVNDNFRSLVGRVFRSVETPKFLILALERKIVDASEEGATDDYRIIRSKVEEAKCEVFYLQPSEIWGDDKLRLHPGWEEEQPNH